MATRPLRLPRQLHPGAWWVWAIGLAVAASRMTNPVLLALIVAVIGVVVSARRTDAPWARGMRSYLYLALIVVAVRVVFRALLDGQHGAHVLVTLPEIPLPEGAAGIRLGGPVSAEGLLAALYDGMRLATLLLCVGAANVLANPKRLLKAMPSALHEVGVAVTVALSVAPQLVESGQRVRRARRLRGDSRRRMRVVREVAIPVLTDALDRSLLLAAAMDSRGYGRGVHTPAAGRWRTGILVLGGLAGVCVGTYGLLDASAPRPLGGPMLVVGLALAGAGLRLGSRASQRTRYRPDPWGVAEWVVAATGVAVAAVVVVAASVDPSGLHPSLQPLRWPDLAALPTVGVLLGALPAWFSPPAELSTAASRSAGGGAGTPDGTADGRLARPADELALGGAR